MNVETLAERVELDPTVAQIVFNRLEAAANLVLPGSDTHIRYRDVGVVGLAVVVARDQRPPDFYNPSDSTILEKLSFTANNQLYHPEAWEPLETDEATLGEPMPDNEKIGRYTVFAIAKINGLTVNKNAKSSHRIEGITIAPGQVGFAGGRRTGGNRTLSAISGLFEVHDDVLNRIYVDQVGSNNKPKTIDTLAGDMESIFGEIKSFQNGVEAPDLTRKQVSTLLSRVDIIMRRYLKDSM